MTGRTGSQKNGGRVSADPVATRKSGSERTADRSPGVPAARVCAVCGASMQGRSPRARFCSDRCRGRARRHRDLVASPPGVSAEGALVEATRAELGAGRGLDSAAGQAALVLAGRIDSGADSGTGLAALVREWRACVDDALRASSPAGDDWIDDLLGAERPSW